MSVGVHFMINSLDGAVNALNELADSNGKLMQESSTDGEYYEGKRAGFRASAKHLEALITIFKEGEGYGRDE